MKSWMLTAALYWLLWGTSVYRKLKDETFVSFLMMLKFPKKAGVFNLFLCQMWEKMLASSYTFLTPLLRRLNSTFSTAWTSFATIFSSHRPEASHWERDSLSSLADYLLWNAPGLVRNSSYRQSDRQGYAACLAAPVKRITQNIFQTPSALYICSTSATTRWIAYVLAQVKRTPPRSCDMRKSQPVPKSFVILYRKEAKTILMN